MVLSIAIPPHDGMDVSGRYVPKHGKIGTKGREEIQGTVDKCSKDAVIVQPFYPTGKGGPGRLNGLTVVITSHPSIFKWHNSGGGRPRGLLILLGKSSIIQVCNRAYSCLEN